MHRTVAIAVVIVLVCSLTAWAAEAAKKPDAATPVYKLTTEELEEAKKNASAYLLPRLVEEAKERNADPLLIEFLRVSFAGWVKEVVGVRETAEKIQETINSDRALSGKTALDRSAALLQLTKKLEYEYDKLMEEPYLAAVWTKEAKTWRMPSSEAVVLTVVDQSNAVVNFTIPTSDKPEFFWVTGIDTAGMYDDLNIQEIAISSRLWENAGTRSYTNAAGAKKTVRCIRPAELKFEQVKEHLDLFEFAAHFKAVQAAIEEHELAKMPEPNPPPPPKYEVRTWTDSTGKFTVEAKFRGVINGNVRLEKADGKTLSIPIKQLSKRDQEWMLSKRDQEWIRNR